MLIGYKRGQGSIVLRVKILDSSVSTGAGKTGLTSASSGLIVSTIADNESTATAYTVAGSTIETITTLGTYATPTATKCRFKEVDATNHKGVYEIQIADARYAVSSAKSLLVSVSGATNGAETDVVLPLRDLDPYDSVRAGLTALPNAAAGASSGLPLSADSSGRVDVLKVNGTSQTARDLGASVLLSSGTGTGQLDFTSGVVKGNVTQLLGTAWLTPSVAGTPDVNAKLHGGTSQTGRDIGLSVLLSSGTGTGQVTLTAGAVTNVLNLVNSPGDSSGTTTLLTRIPGTVQAQTGDAYARLGAPAGASTAADIAAINTKTTNLPSAPAATSDIPTANANADALLDRTAGVETSWTLRQALRIILSAVTGKLSGAATTTVAIRDVGDTKARITATVDADGNRSAVTWDKT